ncbi:hypothetical protein TVAG_360680 [Trichomonas vaginalis G3]|uniref:Tetraspanin family protein n=1 Tax=Trichomonas vaginalis (strain ATCC PRA-98 / G3) TaxID=412133 RepID=A2FLK7_TRIV3|nr:tetraspanin family [Trichomonas vaginalis G3]EAX94221.1 hypothetical protein TVAG_360680 [Trichomonas vaginalis G3]KAI5544380.1 tetraspanin family [Trichomonas vaginalis G3]|eukprot:XP_001307151.1 hypothetical protein [Trichomonas vaginalis G3]
MNRLYIALLITVLCIFASILAVISNESWIVDSGLFTLVQKPIIISQLVAFSFMATAILITLYIFTESTLVYYMHISVSVFALLIEAYYGFIWALTPLFFFDGIRTHWRDNYNTDAVANVQSKLKCCGFMEVGEYTDDNCTESKKNPCYSALTGAFMSNVSSSGAFLLAFLISMGVIDMIFISSVKGNGDHENRLLLTGD